MQREEKKKKKKENLFWQLPDLFLLGVLHYRMRAKLDFFPRFFYLASWKEEKWTKPKCVGTRNYNKKKRDINRAWRMARRGDGN